ncbi:MAG: hypothetical protein LC648_05175 [Novosphingobium sp.]|nr:hypothetical protein [Novosphingobium sp.]
MRLIFTALALAALATGAAGSAKDKDKGATPPAVYQAVVDCRALADPAQRLACFDRTVGEMAKAGDDKDLVVLDRETMRETRKGLFGFNLPKLKLFGGGDDDDQEVTEIESTISGIRTANDGMPIFTIADGARWKQTEGRNVFPKVGDPIRIKKATLGSYMANVKQRAAVRVMRMH